MDHNRGSLYLRPDISTGTPPLGCSVVDSLEQSATARDWLGLMDCAGPGKVYRFAQIVAAAALSLEISASAAMATAGSENFFRAHHERGGIR